MKSSTKYLTPLVAAALAVACSHSPLSAPARAQAGRAGAASAPVPATPSALAAASPLPLRALIVGGGPAPAQSQAGIEGNARYVSGLLAQARSQKVLWGDGLERSASVASVNADRSKYLARLSLAFAFSEEWPREPVGLRAPRLPRLDGAVSRDSVRAEIAGLGAALQPGEAALLYFTGHGSPGRRLKGPPNLPPRRGDSSEETQDDFENTVYWMSGQRPLRVRALAPMLEAIPSSNPLVLVMVQCHAGGFANLVSQGGDPSKPLLGRDVCGFFAATADRMSSGCTPLVNEAESEDFTSHFFGALSGRGRGERRVLDADYNRDGRASMLEAFAYASLHDRSIDVPTCTSQQLLQRFFPAGESWYATPYSRLQAVASPWQRAMLAGLSRDLNLSGEDRLDRASRQAHNLASGESGAGGSPWSKALTARGESLRRALAGRFPGLGSDHKSAEFVEARGEALKYLGANPALWQDFARGIESESDSMESGEVREAMLWRFSDACLALIAEQKLQREGTPEQKAAFAKLRASESRSLFVTQPAAS